MMMMMPCPEALFEDASLRQLSHEGTSCKSVSTVRFQTHLLLLFSKGPIFISLNRECRVEIDFTVNATPVTPNGRTSGTCCGLGRKILTLYLQLIYDADKLRDLNFFGKGVGKIMKHLGISHYRWRVLVTNQS